jgi:hypothetical protein
VLYLHPTYEAFACADDEVVGFGISTQPTKLLLVPMMKLLGNNLNPTYEAFACADEVVG